MTSVWPLFCGVGGLAVAAGMLSIPAARRTALGNVEADWLAKELDLDCIEPDGFTVRCKSGSLMRAYRIGGLAYDTKPEGEQFALHDQRVAFIHDVAEVGVVIRFHGVKRHHAAIYPATWPSPGLQEIGDAEAELYRNAYQLRWYMTLKSSDIAALERADEKVRSLLSAYGAVRLARPEDEKASCPLTGFLNFLVCGDLRDDLPAVSSNISANLPASDLIADKDGTLFSRQPTPRHYRVIAVRKWSELVSGYLMHELMALAGEIEATQVCVPIGSEKAKLALKHQSEGRQFLPGKKIEESLAAKKLLEDEPTSLLETQFSIILRGRTEAEVDALGAEVCRILGNRRITYSVETKGAPTVWFNRLPDHDALYRPLKVFAEVASALWPFESAPTGLDHSQYGDAPVRMFKNGSGQTFSFQFQCTPARLALGNFVMIAPSRSGKSTLMMHLLGGLARFSGVRSFIFDSKEGTRFMVEAMGGLYQSFDKLALNPLDLDDTPINRQRLARLLRLMLGDAGSLDGVEDTLELIISNAFKIPREGGQRTLDTIFEMSFPRRSPLRRVFSRWVTGEDGGAGLYAKVFNAPRDSLGTYLGNSFMCGINMNEALEDPILGPPVVAHNAAAIERLARSGEIKGFVEFVDEAGKLTLNPEFCSWAAEQYREVGKLAGAFGMAFQDPAALHKSGIADAVIENSASFFFFPNPQGSRTAYEPFNLNAEQLNFIFSMPEGRRVLLVQRDAATGIDESTILNIDLDPFGTAKRFYRSGPEAVRDLLEIQQKWGDKWPVHV